MRYLAFTPIFFVLLLGCSHLNTKGVDRIVSYQIISDRLPSSFNELKIIFISDTHYPSTLKIEGVKLLVEQINALEPDIILLGGDYTEKNRKIAESIETIASHLGELKAPLGVFAVLGNHDNYNGREETLAAFKKNGIKMLVNQLEWVTRDTDRIAIAGVDEPYWGHPDFKPIAQQLNQHDFAILLSHHPDFVEQADLSLANLILSGHTHGGQITLFGWAPNTSSRYGQKYKYGQKTSLQGAPLIISSGIGTSRIKIRLGAPSEIVVITLTKLEG